MGDCLLLPEMNRLPFFNSVPDDVLINIFCRLEQDPRDLARLDCVCTRFSEVIRNTCWKLKCMRNAPAVVADLLQRPNMKADRLSEPAGGWASLQKVLVCCPGLMHAGVLLENWDFGLDRELGLFDIGEGTLPDTTMFTDCFIFDRKTESEGSVLAQETQGELRYESHRKNEEIKIRPGSGFGACISRRDEGERIEGREVVMDDRSCTVDGSLCDTVEMSECKYSNSTSSATESDKILYVANVAKVEGKRKACCEEADAGQRVIPTVDAESVEPMEKENKGEQSHKVTKRQRTHDNSLSHVASGSWNLSREQGNKLLANRFRADSLYICDWPGCIHPGIRRKYKLFRGVFKNFKNSHVWRNLKDLKAKTSTLGCAFCPCKSTWDMVSTFCLKRSIEYHDDGEPVVRAFVCQNGHVAGSWTDRPICYL